MTNYDHIITGNYGEDHPDNQTCAKCELREKHKEEGCDCYECWHDVCPDCGEE